MVTLSIVEDPVLELVLQLRQEQWLSRSRNADREPWLRNNEMDGCWRRIPERTASESVRVGFIGDADSGANLNDGGDDDRVRQRTTTRRHRPEVCVCSKTTSVSFETFQGQHSI